MVHGAVQPEEGTNSIGANCHPEEMCAGQISRDRGVPPGREDRAGSTGSKNRHRKRDVSGGGGGDDLSGFGVQPGGAEEQAEISRKGHWVPLQRHNGGKVEGMGADRACRGAGWTSP